ncbi:MAG: MFS transporter, partial [Pseudomonadota bacterium]
RAGSSEDILRQVSVTGEALKALGHVARVNSDALIAGVPLQLVLIGFAGSAFAIIIWALIPDTVEYGQYSNGRRDEGAVFGSSLFVQKASGGLTGLAVGYFLSGIGYDSDREVQSAETAMALGSYMALVPSILLIIASITLFLMPLSRDLHARIVDELSR